MSVNLEIIRVLRDLVALPSVNPMGRDLKGPEIFEHRVTAYLRDYFTNLGVDYEIQPVAPLRENIVARWDCPGATRTLVFEAHQDTVPVDNMNIDPFDPRIEDGKMYGRGSCDIKGGMTAMLVAFARLVRDKPRGAANVIMACSVDEEFTALGVHRLVKGLKADVAVVAEPTELNIVNTHKGIVRWHMHTQGRSCHSSQPEKGINAIYRMARLVTGLERYAEHLRATRHHPVLGAATMSVGIIAGGTSVNTVPENCRIEIDRRLLPGEDGTEAVNDLLAFLKKDPAIDFEFRCEIPWTSKKALSPDNSAGLVTDLGKAIDAVRGSHQVVGVPYGTDGSTIAESGIPTVIFGPGDIARAHTADEWVPLDEVEQASEILYRFACAG